MAPYDYTQGFVFNLVKTVPCYVRRVICIRIVYPFIQAVLLLQKQVIQKWMFLYLKATGCVMHLEFRHIFCHIAAKCITHCKCITVSQGCFIAKAGDIMKGGCWLSQMRRVFQKQHLLQKLA